MIPDEMLPALMGVVPATLITASKDGIPNITNISRVWYVDSHHVAIANHMLNKSLQNLAENPYAFIKTMDTTTFSTWELEVEFAARKKDGAIFAEMKKQYEVLSMMMENELPITVKSAELFTVLSARICTEENDYFHERSENYHILLKEFENKLSWKNSAVWKTEDDQLTAIRGLDEESANKFLFRVVQSSVIQQKPIKILNIRSQYQYAFTTFLHLQEEDQFSLEDYQRINHNYMAIPIWNQDKIEAVIGIESDDPFLFTAFKEEILQAASRHLSQLFETIQEMNDVKERHAAINQCVERIRLELTKRSSNKKMTLSVRELQVAVQVSKGLSNEEIAKALFLSKRTVTTHLERIFQKLEITSRAALASYVIENGLIDSSS